MLLRTSCETELPAQNADFSATATPITIIGQEMGADSIDSLKAVHCYRNVMMIAEKTSSRPK